LKVRWNIYYKIIEASLMGSFLFFLAAITADIYEAAFIVVTILSSLLEIFLIMIGTTEALRNTE
jgi:hypothetical protein